MKRLFVSPVLVAAALVATSVASAEAKEMSDWKIVGYNMDGTIRCTPTGCGLIVTTYCCEAMEDE